ncbi:MAG TPA: crotonase/enoyl-CoA hydratase family protein [Spongiibacteraceae bacterium]|nr:crotonase/enoyl-CoA hydratase family protein [Spongiibacteraceae bacterium]
MYQRLQIDLDPNGIAHVQLARPEKMNALDAVIFPELIRAAEELAANPQVRVVVMSGQGRAFCAGLDLSLFSNPNLRSMLGDNDANGVNDVQRAVWAWRMLPVPVLAAVHGTAFGGGLQLMLGADLRFVAPDTRLSIMEIDYGIIPDICGTQLWGHLVREDVMRELVFTGRIFDGNEAVTLGFATKLADDPLAAALAMATTIANKSPDAIRAAKKLINDYRSTSVADGLRREAQTQIGLLFGPNQLEAVAAKMEKRAPQFSDPK